MPSTACLKHGVIFCFMLSWHEYSKSMPPHLSGKIRPYGVRVGLDAGGVTAGKPSENVRVGACVC